MKYLKHSANKSPFEDIDPKLEHSNTYFEEGKDFVDQNSNFGLEIECILPKELEFIKPIKYLKINNNYKEFIILINRLLNFFNSTYHKLQHLDAKEQYNILNNLKPEIINLINNKNYNDPIMGSMLKGIIEKEYKEIKDISRVYNFIKAMSGLLKDRYNKSHELTTDSPLKRFIKEYRYHNYSGVCKSDESIESTEGLEIALPPLTLEEIKKHPVWEMLKKYKAFVDESCGLHISVPRKYMSDAEWFKIKVNWRKELLNKSEEHTGRMPTEFCSIAPDISRDFLHFDAIRAEYRSFAGTVDLKIVEAYIYNIIASVNNALKKDIRNKVKELEGMKNEICYRNIEKVKEKIQEEKENEKYNESNLPKYLKGPEKTELFHYAAAENSEYYETITEYLELNQKQQSGLEMTTEEKIRLKELHNILNSKYDIRDPYIDNSEILNYYYIDKDSDLYKINAILMELINGIDNSFSDIVNTLKFGTYSSYSHRDAEILIKRFKVTIIGRIDKTLSYIINNKLNKYTSIQNLYSYLEDFKQNLNQTENKRDHFEYTKYYKFNRDIGNLQEEIEKESAAI